MVQCTKLVKENFCALHNFLFSQFPGPSGGGRDGPCHQVGKLGHQHREPRRRGAAGAGDIDPKLLGGLGLAPSANLNPERAYPSMFEPVHGSAADIAGRGIANPIGALASAAMMLDHLGESAAGARLTAAIERVTGSGDALTPDLGGTATTAALADAVCRAIAEADG